MRSKDYFWSDHFAKREERMLKMKKLEERMEKSDPAKGEVVEVPPDQVNHPPHYNKGAIECIDAIEAATAHLTNGYLAYCIGNVIKYVWRFSYKGQPKQDLEKAAWYLQKAISTFDK